MDESFQPVTLAGRGTFDGTGTFAGTEWRVLGDDFGPVPVFHTTFTVSSDCTGETSSGYYFVWVGDGSEAFGIRTARSWVAIGSMKKQ
jgi:hypothetical protein